MNNRIFRLPFMAMLTAVLLLFCPGGIAESVEGELQNIRIAVNGEKIILLDSQDVQQKSIVHNDQVYVPLVPFIQALGGDIDFDQESGVWTVSLPAGGKSTSDPAGEFLGSWKSGSTVSLDIKADGTAGFMLNGTAYSCTWYLDGNTLQMLQNGKGGVSAVLNGNTLDLSIGGKHFSLTR